jgi:hypothetical protein
MGQMWTRIFIVAGMAALLARLTVFDDTGTVEAFVSFAAFWVCAGGWFISYVTS